MSWSADVIFLVNDLQLCFILIYLILWYYDKIVNKTYVRQWFWYALYDLERSIEELYKIFLD